MLKRLLLEKEKREYQEQLDELRKVDFKSRERNLGIAIEEAETKEEREAIAEEVTDYEKEKKEHDKKIEELEKKIKDIDEELEELDKEVEVKTEEGAEEGEEREEFKPMETREMFGGYTRDQVKKLTERQDVRGFLDRVKELKGHRRGVTDTDLLIPEVLIGILRDNIHKYSKLLNKVWFRSIKGEGRIILPGTIPEAVWTEACATLNELEFGFNDMEFDGYKVGGFIPICNATLEDASYVDLYNEIMYMLAQAIGLALDKAIIYGTGNKMPLGIVTRLAQTVEPDNYPKTARKWVNLKETNIATAAGETAAELFADLIEKTAAAKPNYSTGRKFWIMNEATWTGLQAKLVTMNAAGALVSSMQKTMPIIGGQIETLPFIPEGDIIGGYADMYLLLERAGMKLAVSEHVQFIEDNTVFKGTARYDGAPAIPEAFVAININGGTVTETIEFAEDKANAEEVPGA